MLKVIFHVQPIYQNVLKLKTVYSILIVKPKKKMIAKEDSSECDVKVKNQIMNIKYGISNKERLHEILP